MPRILVALAAGLLFGLGLVVSGMVDPAKVLGFLDVAGDWDPSLAFVMAAAIPVAALGFRLGGRMPAPLCAPAFAPPARAADRRAAARRRRALRHRLGPGGLLPGPGARLARLRRLAGAGSSWRRCWPGWGSTAWPRAAPRPAPAAMAPDRLRQRNAVPAAAANLRVLAGERP